jgi:hypothetical protein
MLPQVSALASQDEERQHVLARCSGLASACAAAMMNANRGAHTALWREHPKPRGGVRKGESPAEYLCPQDESAVSLLEIAKRKRRIEIQKRFDCGSGWRTYRFKSCGVA